MIVWEGHISIYLWNASQYESIIYAHDLRKVAFLFWELMVIELINKTFSDIMSGKLVLYACYIKPFVLVYSIPLQGSRTRMTNVLYCGRHPEGDIQVTVGSSLSEQSNQFFFQIHKKIHKKRNLLQLNSGRIHSLIKVQKHSGCCHLKPEVLVLVQTGSDRVGGSVRAPAAGSAVRHGEELPPVGEEPAVVLSGVHHQAQQEAPSRLAAQRRLGLALRHVEADVQQLEEQQVEQPGRHQGAVPRTGEAQRRAAEDRTTPQEQQDNTSGTTGQINTSGTTGQ